ncbi:hypothetical protein CASFOL_016364 [Castilleja foliolosa]|uniref:Pectinesterase n=1 Tax=Castilleja foliolosa TaxID=1961234 RepID=A0ABD3DKF8_9LAMI
MAPKSTHKTSIIFISLVVITFFSCATSKEKSYSCRFKSINDLCNVTLFPDLCKKSLLSINTSNRTGANMLRVAFEQSALLARNEVSKALPDFHLNGTIEKITANKIPNKKLAFSALESCQTLLSLATESLGDLISSNHKISSSRGARDDVRTWLSAVGTDLQTCLDEFDEFVDELRKAVRDKLESAIRYTSNSLAIMTRVDMCLSSRKKKGSDKLDFPYWLRLKNDETKRLLDMSKTEIKPNLVVAQDGSGNYTRINDALENVPNRRKDKFIIYVKKGIYYENVKVEKKKWHVMVIGDGLGETIVSGNLNYDDGTKTFKTATFAVFGRGFIARQMVFQNTARKSQAVALLSASDRSVFYQCIMDSKQDTLYVHSKRQFYRECYILGTIDFIFGNAAVVIQRSAILPKNPSPGKTNVITAQGKSDPFDNTGLSIQNCTIIAAEDLKGVRTFLGRPWRNFSTTVIMHSRMDGSIDPEGWLAWNDEAPPSTIFYGEYKNMGPGANTSGRVKWAGVRTGLSSDEAEEFTVSYLIDGKMWLPKTGVPFGLGLV